MKRAVMLLVTTASICVFAEDLPPRFDWRDVDGKCYVTPVKRQSGSEDLSYAYAPMDCLESQRLIYCIQTPWNSLDDEGKKRAVFSDEEIAANIASARSCRDSVDWNLHGVPSVAKSLDWMVRTPFDGRLVAAVSFVDGINPMYDIGSAYWDAGLYNFKRHLKETPFMAEYQHVEEYTMDGKYCYYPEYFKTQYEEPEYSRTALVIGYDDTIPASCFMAEGRVPPKDGAWIVKGCRGTDFGDDGYYYISYYDYHLLRCDAITTQHLSHYIAFPVIDGMFNWDAGAYGKVWGYALDTPSGFGMRALDYYGVVLTAEEDAIISGVGLFDLDGYSRDIWISVGCSTQNPAGGKEIIEERNAKASMAANGYNIYVLPSPVEVKKGQLFSIMVCGKNQAFIAKTKEKDGFVKGRYFHASWVKGGVSRMEWFDIAKTAEQEGYAEMEVPFIVACTKREGVSLEASKGDYVDEAGNVVVEDGIEVKWTTTVKSNDCVYDLYRAAHGSGFFTLVASGLRGLRYVDRLLEKGGSVLKDVEYDYKVIDVEHDIESNLGMGFVAKVPRLFDAEAARLWLTGEGPYNVRLTWNAYNPVYIVDVDWEISLKSNSQVYYRGHSSNVGNPHLDRRKTVDVSETIPVIATGNHGRYQVTVKWTARNIQNGNKHQLPTAERKCDANVYFSKYRRESGKGDISNWFYYWPRDGAIESSFFKQRKYDKGNLYQYDSKFYFEACDLTDNKGKTDARLMREQQVSDRLPVDIGIFGESHEHRFSTNSYNWRLCRVMTGLQYYLSDLGAAVGAKITSQRYPGYSGPPVGEESKGLQKVADTIEHERQHGYFYEKLFNGKYCFAGGDFWLKPVDLIDWTEWAKAMGGAGNDFLLPYAGKWAVDFDGDSLSDVDETQLSNALGVNLKPDNPDTLCIRAYNVEYASYGDNEYVARAAESGRSVSIFPKKDWAFPGNQVAQCYQGHQNTLHAYIEGGEFLGFYPYWGKECDVVKRALQTTYPSEPSQCSCGHDNCFCASSSCNMAFTPAEEIEELFASSQSLTPQAVMASPKSGGVDASARESGVLTAYHPDDFGTRVDGGLVIASVGEGSGLDNGYWEYESLVFPVAVTNTSDTAKSCIMRGYLLDADENTVAWASRGITVPANGIVEESLVFDGKDIFVAYDTRGYTLASVVLEPYESNYCTIYDMTNAMARTDCEYYSDEFTPPKGEMFFDHAKEYVDDEGLTILLPVSNTTTGDLHVVAVLSDTNGHFVAQADGFSRSWTYDDVELKFSRSQINYSGGYGPFVLSLVQALDGGEVVCGARDAYVTQKYAANDFLDGPARPLSFAPRTYQCLSSGDGGVDCKFSISNEDKSRPEFNIRLIVRSADGAYAGSVSTNAALAAGANNFSIPIKARNIAADAEGPFYVAEIIFSPVDSAKYDRVRFTPTHVEFTVEGDRNEPDPDIAITVRFHANGGTGEMQNQTFGVGSSPCLNLNRFSVPGRYFLGWTTKATGYVDISTLYPDGSDGHDFDNWAGGFVDLYAVWGKPGRTSGKLNQEGEWHNRVNVNWGQSHMFWIDGLSADTAVSGIDVEGEFQYEENGEIKTDEVYVSEEFDLFDESGNRTAIYCILTTNDWPLVGNVPSHVRFNVEVYGFYDDEKVANNRFRFGHADGMLPVELTWDVRFEAGEDGVIQGVDSFFVDCEYANGAPLGALPKPVRENFYFVGWFTAPDGGERVLPSDLAQEDMTLYAHWTDQPFARFVVPEVAAEENGLATVAVFGGDDENVASMKLYLTYNTATAADLDLAKGAVDGAMPKGGLKFPLTLSWAKGEIGEKVITIPIKADKTVEDDEFLTLQLAEAVGMELGDERVCTVTIRDMNDKTLKTTVTPYKPKKGETVATNSVTVASGNAKGGFVSGTGEYTSGSKLTLTAEARPGWAFVGWRRANSEDVVSDKAKWQIVVTNDAEYVAVFEKIPYVRGLADPADGGKVAGSGLCDKGKKVTMKATANKNFVFVGWCQGTGNREQVTGNGERGTGMPGFEERLQKGAVEYVATTPSLVVDRSAKPAKDTATSTTITNVTDDVTYYACFITSDEDKASIVAVANGWTLEPWVSKTETHALRTNIWAGVYLEWPVTASALSEAKVKVAGLPAGLKFTDKPVTTKIGTGKAAVTVTNVPANTIYGAPTAASKIDAKTKALKPSEVKLTVTTAGKSSQTYQIDTVVDALPTWAQGTFAGGWEPEDAATSGGQVSLTVDAKGKVSGKALGEGLTYTLAAPYYSGFAAVDDGESVYSNFLADVTASWSYKEDSKTIKTNEVVQLVVQDNIIGGYAAVEDWFDAYTANWKVEPWKALGKKFDKQTMVYAILTDGTPSDDEKYDTVALGEEVTGRVTLKFAASGAVTVAGEFVSGAYNDKTKKYPTVKATGSATLVPVDDEHGEVFIYLTPKGLPPHARCVTVPWPEE